MPTKNRSAFDGKSETGATAKPGMYSVQGRGAVSMKPYEIEPTTVPNPAISSTFPGYGQFPQSTGT